MTQFTKDIKDFFATFFSFIKTILDYFFKPIQDERTCPECKSNENPNLI